MDTEALERVSLERLDEWLHARQAVAREALAAYNAAFADLQRGYRVLTRRLCRPPTAVEPQEDAREARG